MSKSTRTITEADRAILLALSRFHYLTAGQVSRLLYPNLLDENRYAQRRLKRLADAGYVLRLRALPAPRYGQAPHVFTLGQRGRKYLTALGMAVPTYFRPSEEAKAAENSPFMEHRLAAIDVLIAADCLCRDYPVRCPQIRTERELKSGAVRVEVPAGNGTRDTGSRRVAVIPDAWFQLAVAGGAPISIALELDRGTEDQQAWRKKVAALAVWAQGPYREAFATDNLTIAVVCPTDQRRQTLTRWTLAELTGCGQEVLAEIFLFTAASPVTTSPKAFYFAELWHLPNWDAQVSLLDAPDGKLQEVSSRVV